MGSFLHNGGVGALEFDVRPCDGEMIERRTFNQPFVLIGRSPASDLRLLRGGVFEMRMGSDPPVRWRVNRPLTLVGRADACKLRLRDLRVSGFHCSLTAGPLGVWVVDLLSREGVRLNGQRVRWAALE